MLADPQSVTINAVAFSLPRTATGSNTATYTYSDGTVILANSHSYAKRTRRTARLTQSKLSADPLNPAVNTNKSISVYLVIDQPIVGFTNTEILNLGTAFTSWLTASSNANFTKLIAGES